jgi:hypothetical protein
MHDFSKKGQIFARKMSHLKNSIYMHVKSGKLYRLLAIGREVENPQVSKVAYEQLYTSRLRGAEQDAELPVGTVWFREVTDFENKFVLASMDETKNSRKLPLQDPEKKIN